MIDVAVIGADDDVVAANFDDATNTWLLRTSSGGERRARVVIDERTLHLAAEWDPAFDPTGKRIAVIGDRAAPSSRSSRAHRPRCSTARRPSRRETPSGAGYLADHPDAHTW